MNNDNYLMMYLRAPGCGVNDRRANSSSLMCASLYAPKYLNVVFNDGEQKKVFKKQGFT